MASPSVITSDGIIHVNAGELKRIEIVTSSGEILPDVLSLEPGSDFKFAALGYDEYDNALSIIPNWAMSRDLGEIMTLGPDTGYATFSNTSCATGSVTISMAGYFDEVEVGLYGNPTKRNETRKKGRHAIFTFGMAERFVQ